MEAMLSLVKMALRVSGDAYDAQLNMLIEAALGDLGIAGVTNTEPTDPLIQQAVCTYCAFMFGNVDNADQLKRVYDEQKAQLSMHTGHTDWLEGGE